MLNQPHEQAKGGRAPLKHSWILTAIVAAFGIVRRLVTRETPDHLAAVARTVEQPPAVRSQATEVTPGQQPTPAAPVCSQATEATPGPRTPQTRQTARRRVTERPLFSRPRGPPGSALQSSAESAGRQTTGASATGYGEGRGGYSQKARERLSWHTLRLRTSPGLATLSDAGTSSRSRHLE